MPHCVLLYHQDCFACHQDCCATQGVIFDLSLGLLRWSHLKG
jgi:hypothetical protein